MYPSFLAVFVRSFFIQVPFLFMGLLWLSFPALFIFVDIDNSGRRFNSCHSLV